MAALAPAAPFSLLASLPASPSPPHATAISSARPPRLLLRLPEQDPSDTPRNPFKRKWKSFVNLFALPIRTYYLEPPGGAYRAELQARRAADDEMVLFKAQEEAEALAAQQQQDQAQEEEDGDVEREEEPASSAAAESSPEYEASNPFSIPQARRGTNVIPSFGNGTPMLRHVSTPLTPTPFSTSPPTRTMRQRSRAQSSATGTRPTIGARNISEPLSWTLVRSQYSFPKRGLTAEQLSFLSSVESLGRLGVPHTPTGAAVPAEIRFPSPAYEVRGEERGEYGFPIV
ncbi:uncharacterized protein UHO2_06879 [Ustilago hordei]|uniref:Uncharacterized protein n=1 Tax=Ustilago hordei TaxID=120017 RepID=I2FZF4_USTHO|nr:uncharacterized protein UHO2_06879 [Ustilago hordei]KAJ1577087.1 hypothetical protein NDA15_006945 [Ustilago hordei]KAJ1578704.1 hypothetical protein NDA12_005078 [Ustilago hordei]CCF52297.1 uncharacterized protein UHOR_03602 [Ustilago hordei]SYW83683.1 uncharacterized protein UHO2_06879 [Ustilago hordei]